MFKIQQKHQMLLLTMFCYLFFYTGRHNFGWASKPLSEDLGLSYEFIGWISFSMLLGYSLGQLINGALADRLNPKYMVPIGAYLSIACNVGISFSHSGMLILVLWFLNGMFQSMAWAPGGKIITHWFAAGERTKAFGMYTMAAGFSSAVTFLLSIYLTSLELEWRMLFRLPVLCLFISATVFLIFIKPSPNKLNNTTKTNIDLKAMKASYISTFKDSKFIQLCLSFGLESMARYGLIFWVPVHYLGLDWKANPSFIWITLFLPLGMALGAFTFGQLGASLFKNNYTSIVFGMLSSFILSMSIFFYGGSNMVIIGALLLFGGFFVYGPQTNFWSLCPEIRGAEATGTAIGVMNMFGYLCAALIEPILGKVIDVTGNTSILFIIISMICLLSAINIIVLKYRIRN